MSRILFWSADTGACGHYRCTLPAAGLRGLGHEVDVAMRINAATLRTTDVWVGQRVCRPEASALWQTVARDRHRPRMVFELDDDVWALRHERHNPAAAEWGPLVDNVARNLAVADAVTVSTAELAEVVSAHTSAPVHVVPNAVPDDIVGPQPAADRAPGYPVHSIGWQGSATHNGDWIEAARPVARWVARRGVELRILGPVPAPLLKQLHAAQAGYSAVGWINGDWPRYYAAVRSAMSLGIAPLAVSTFNRSKSDLRLLEYAALGIPWVASDYGPYARDAEARGGWRVQAPHEWGHVLSLAAVDPAARASVVRDGLRWARTRTVSAAAPRWAEALGITVGV